METSELKNLSSLFKILADPHRLAMLERLCNCQQASVGELANCCEVDLSVVSRHLSKLKKAGILRAQKRGKEVFYDLSPNELANILRALADRLEGCCQTKEKT